MTEIPMRRDTESRLQNCCFFLIFSSENMNDNLVLTEDQIRTARFAKALGHPIRVYILQLLSKQSCCYSGDLSDVLPVAKSTISQHLKELKSAGLIQGEIKPPKIKYCLNRDTWDEAKKMLENLFE
jgi:ArsR family transcriptional regulator, arsenate/arsenite/antimonite-responsive transcriptional repressor